MIKTNQKGFTLIEVLIAVAITGLIVGAASGAGAHVIQSKRTTAQMVALRQVQTAGYWVSRDALCAQSVTTGGGSGFPLTLTWTDIGDKDHEVIYSLEDVPSESLKQLQRQETIDTDVTTMMAGQYIDPGNTSCVWSDGTLTFTVTAEVTGARGSQTETRTYEVMPRPLS